jgi:preprotein translocase SecE subunit
MLKQYIQESLQDLNNVTWPTKKQAIRITTVVFVFMVISAAALGLVDQFLAWGYRLLISI